MELILHSLIGGWPTQIYLDDFKNCHDVEEATRMFEQCFERASLPWMDQRIEWAEMYYESYKGSSVVNMDSSGNIYTEITQYNWGTGGTGNFQIGDFDETMWITDLNCYQTNQTAASYITNVLAKASVKVPEGYTTASIAKMLINDTYDQLDISSLSQGYVYGIKGSMHSFKAIDFNSVASPINISYGTQSSNVISFAVSNVGVMVMTNSNVDANGQPLIDSSSLDYLSGDSVTYEALGKTTDETKTKYENWYSLNESLSNIEVKSSASQESLTANVICAWGNLQNWTISAELTLWRRKKWSL